MACANLDGVPSACDVVVVLGVLPLRSTGMALASSTTVVLALGAPVKVVLVVVPVYGPVQASREELVVCSITVVRHSVAGRPPPFEAVVLHSITVPAEPMDVRSRNCCLSSSSQTVCGPVRQNCKGYINLS